MRAPRPRAAGAGAVPLALAALLTLSIALAVPAAAAADADRPAEPSPPPFAVAFRPPGQVEGAVEAEGLQWVLVVVPPEASLEFQASLPSGGMATTRAYAEVRNSAGGSDATAWPPGDASWRVAPGTEATWRLGEGRWSSLLIVADAVGFASPAAGGTLVRAEAGEPVKPLLPHGVPAGAVSPSSPLVPAAGPALTLSTAALAAPLTLQVEAESIRQLAWHNVTLRCDPDCDRGGAAGALPGMPGAGGVAFREYTTLDAGVGAGRGTASGWAAAAALGGTLVDLAVDGWLRLPRAELEPCPGACDEGQTLRADGRVALTGLHADPDGPGRLQAGMSGDGALALDETPRSDLLAPAALLAGGAAATGLLAVLWKAAAAFLAGRSSRPSDGETRRQHLTELVLRDPGMSFRELERRVGWGNGVTRHHLSILVRQGVLVERRHLNTVRYFENHGRYDASWKAVVHARDAGDRWLADVVGQAPRTQAELVAMAAEAHGWSRSATQRRVARLLAGGLLVPDRAGGVLQYRPGRSAGAGVPVPEQGR